MTSAKQEVQGWLPKGNICGNMASMDLYAALKVHFGHSEFRPYQHEIIAQVMEGRDTLGVLPTGAGKSLCYQLPALLLPRPTLVISPLIALMQDQLDGLPPAVYPQATLINSSIDGEELERRMEGIQAGQYRLIYAAPERLRQRGFLQTLRHVGLSLAVVDEAHCVSVWGHDFRPDYLFIRRALLSLEEQSEEAPTLLALTATATPEMQTEIATQLGRTLTPITASTFRPNLRLEVFPCANADDKMKRLAAICQQTAGAAIVYANSRDKCEQLATLLNRQGVRAAFYHAGLEREMRRQTQEQFMLGKVRVIVATVAFGMGVDKANVRLVVHFSLPQSLEAYTQEAGRAGRDGKPSRCVLLYTSSDKTTLSRWLRQEDVKLETVRDTYRAVKARIGKGAGTVPPDALLQDIGETVGQPGTDTRLRVALSMLERCGMLRRHADRGRDLQLEMLSAPSTARAELDALLAARTEHNETRLREMVGYTEGTECRHAVIARHFGQEMARCGDACDLCLGTALPVQTAVRALAPTAAEVPDVGRVLLETVHDLPFAIGRTGLAKIVSGAADSPISHDRCAQFGMLPGFTLKALRAFMDQLIADGLLEQDHSAEYPLLRITTAGQNALQRNAILLANPITVTPKRRILETLSTADLAPSSTPNLPDADEDDRFEQLRAWRRIEAEQAKVPPFVIFHDSTLRAIAHANPTTLEALSFIPGIGGRKRERYGAALLELLHGA